MVNEMQYLLRQPMVKGALIGFLAAFVQDLREYRKCAADGQKFKFAVASSKWIEGADWCGTSGC